MHDEGRGSSIRQISLALKVSRNTVRKYLRAEVSSINEALSERSRAKVLDAHRSYLAHLLQTYPRLSAVKAKRKLEAQVGPVAVSARSLRRYLGKLRGEVSPQAQPRYYEPVLDEVPGVQCQVDAGELREVLVNGLATTVHFVVFVLSWSRLMYVGFSQRAFDTERFIQVHDEAFRYFGGCPQECVYDQTRLVVVAEHYRELTLNERFAQYASTVGFTIRACEGYDPESKGKVEAGVKYVKNDALYAEQFDQWSGLMDSVHQWLEQVANCRIHGTTGEPPRARFEARERATLTPYLCPGILAAPGELGEPRKVDKTGLISFRGNKYSVPMAFQRGRVNVVATDDGHLTVHHCHTAEVLAVHPLNPGKGILVKNGDHYRDKAQRQTELEQAIEQAFDEGVGRQLCEQLVRYEPRHYLDKLRGVNRHLARLQRLPPAVLGQLLERPQGLTVTVLIDYLSAWEANPERVALLATPPPPSPDAGPSNRALLSPYASLTAPGEA